MTSYGHMKIDQVIRKGHSSMFPTVRKIQPPQQLRAWIEVGCSTGPRPIETMISRENDIIWLWRVYMYSPFYIIWNWFFGWGDWGRFLFQLSARLDWWQKVEKHSFAISTVLPNLNLNMNIGKTRWAFWACQVGKHPRGVGNCPPSF